MRASLVNSQLPSELPLDDAAHSEMAKVLLASLFGLRDERPALKKWREPPASISFLVPHRQATLKNDADASSRRSGELRWSCGLQNKAALERHRTIAAIFEVCDPSRDVENRVVPVGGFGLILNAL
jgi:hypothetical protein